MAETLTDVDTFPASIQMPTAGEVISAADLRDKAIQRLANRTYYNNLNIADNAAAIADIESERVYAAFAVTGSGIATAASFTLATTVNVSGFTLSTNTIIVPEAGNYLINFLGTFINSSSTNPETVRVSIGLGAGLSQQHNLESQRYSTSTTDFVGLGGGFVVTITTPASDYIRVIANQGGSGNLSVNNSSQISVLRLRD